MDWQFGWGSAWVVLLLVLPTQQPSAGYATAAGWSRMASLMSYGCWLLSGETWFSCTSPLQLASSGSFTSWSQSSGCSENKAGPNVFATVPWPIASSDFKDGQNRLYLWMEGATKSYCKGTLIDKWGFLQPSLQTVPQKAINSQKKHSWGEDHTLEKLSQSNIWPISRLNSSSNNRSHLLNASCALELLQVSPWGRHITVVPFYRWGNGETRSVGSSIHCMPGVSQNQASTLHAVFNF